MTAQLPLPPTGRRRLAEQPRRRISPWLLTALLAVLAFVVVFGAVSCLRDDPRPAVTSAGAPVVPKTAADPAPSSATPAPTPAAVPNAVPTADLPEGAVSGNLGEGDAPYVVGQDMRAGKYLTAGPLVAGQAGTWERQLERSRPRAEGRGTITEVVRGTVDGPEVIVVKAGDRLVVRGLKPLHRVG